MHFWSTLLFYFPCFLAYRCRYCLLFVVFPLRGFKGWSSGLVPIETHISVVVLIWCSFESLMFSFSWKCVHRPLYHFLRMNLPTLWLLRPYQVFYLLFILLGLLGHLDFDLLGNKFLMRSVHIDISPPSSTAVFSAAKMVTTRSILPQNNGNLPLPFFVVINLLLSWIICIIDCICILTGLPG